MKALTTIPFPDAPEQVAIGFTAEEARELAEDLAKAGNACADDGPLAGRLFLLAQVLRHQLGHLARPVTRGELSPQVVADVSLNPPAADPFTGTFKGIPVQHVEWAVRVYKATDGARAENETLARVFEKGEAPAKAFFRQTQNIWNIKVNSGEAQCFHVVLGVQDARKHKKKGSFREVDVALCTGGVR